MSNRKFWMQADCAPPLLDIRLVKRDIFGGDAPAAPDYTPMAAASRESAQIMADQGDRVLEESKRQYDQNMAVAKPVAEAQQRIMDETARQGKDYYDYNTSTFRPLEQGMVADAVKEGSDARIEEAAGTAVADTRRGQTQQANMLMRQGMRYGFAPKKIATLIGGMGTANASAVAGAATGARDKQRSIGWARRMDAAGLGRGLPGASTGAYSVATGAGTSAVSNTMAPGTQLINGMTSAANITGQGRSLLQSGLGTVAGMQSNNYNTAVANDNSGLGTVLGMAKMGMDIYSGGASAGLWGSSDRRLKENIALVGKDERTGLNLYEFNYIGDGKRLRGVMADEVEPIMPDAVSRDDLGFASVNYGMLGLEMVEV